MEQRSATRAGCAYAPPVDFLCHMFLRKATHLLKPIFDIESGLAAMNFVDVQPKSFLDYAWTTPSTSLTQATKPSKTSRKQNRCCDQCRKGKRACDAAILEDTLLDSNGSSNGSPNVFHYSGESDTSSDRKCSAIDFEDVFGPLAPCANCEKTKKRCTFEWLRSQRMSQASPHSSTTPPAKRRRTESGSSNSPDIRSDITSQLPASKAPHSTTLSDTSTPESGDFVRPGELGLTFADFPGMSVVYSKEPCALEFRNDFIHSGAATSVPTEHALNSMHSSKAQYDLIPEKNSEQNILVGASTEGSNSGSGTVSSSSSDSGLAKIQNGAQNDNGAVTRLPKKRRRRSSLVAVPNEGVPHPTLPMANDFISLTNKAMLTENLLRIYHESFENALSCWLTERTCPYSEGSSVSLANDAGPDWKSIYHRVFRLDRLALPIRGRRLTCSEDQAASKAINLAIISFAAQWVQPYQAVNSKYPFHNSLSDDRGNNAFIEVRLRGGFERTLQISAWHEARVALQNTTGIESFRVALAQIVFSMTQNPGEAVQDELQMSVKCHGDSICSPKQNQGYGLHEESTAIESKDINQCTDLMSKLELAIDGEGPPVHLEQGLRLIHSLKSRMNIIERSKTAYQSGHQFKTSPNRLDTTDRVTVDMLFWLGVMFDTLSSAMHKRPLVVPDEDCDIYSEDPRPMTADVTNGNLMSQTRNSSAGLWDDHLFARQRKRLQRSTLRWPCSFEQQASFLCDAAPIKVLLFRKVTYIQTLLSRNAIGGRIENAVRAALDLYDHWGRLYAPFIQDCTRNYDSLPQRVQTWHICLTGHWHLAALLMVDLIEIIDNSELSTEPRRHERRSNNVVSKLRLDNANSLADLARCACPSAEELNTETQAARFVLKEGGLLTEPWTAVLIRAFAKAGAVLLQSDGLFPPKVSRAVHQDTLRRTDSCVRVLQYLGGKSDMALSAARILGDALKDRRKGSQEKLSNVDSVLRQEM